MGSRGGDGLERLRRIIGERPEEEVRGELEHHRDMRVRDLVAGGMDPEAAYAKAQEDFGDWQRIARECTHIAERRNQKMQLSERFSDLRQDLRFAVRALLKNRGFSLLAVLTLAIGIGASTAIFSVVNGVLLRPLPFADADRLMMVWQTDRSTGTLHEPGSFPDFVDVAEQTSSFAAVAAFLPVEMNLMPADGEPVRVPTLRVSHELFPMLGITPLIGREFAPEEDRPGGAAVALISEQLWDRRFGRDPAVVGRTLDLDGRTFSVVGVLPATAGFGTLQILRAADYGRAFADRGTELDVGIWIPLAASAEELPRSTHPLFIAGRLAAGATVASAQEELAGLAAELEAAYPENEARGVHVEPLQEVVFGPVRPALMVLLGAAALVLLIACGNVANLLLVRGMGRVHEVAVRTALGARGGRLVRQFLVESLVLTSLAALAGVWIAWLALEVLLALAPADISRISQVAIDQWALGFTLCVSLLVGATFGMLPSLQTRRLDIQQVLVGGGTRSATGGRDGGRLRAALVAVEVGLAVVLLVGAGLLLKSFSQLVEVDPGFRTDEVLKVEFQLPPSRYPADFSNWPDFREMHRFNAALLEEVSRLPGVRAASISGNHPLDPGVTNSFAIVGREAESREWPEISVRRVTPGYFATFGTSLRRGRVLGDEDGTGAPAVAVINEAAAERLFPAQDPLGQQIAFWGAARTIVGVVGNEKFQGLDEADPIAVYTPLAQTPSANGAESLAIRVDGDPMALAPAVRSAIRGLDPALAVFGVEPLDDTLSRSVGQRRFTMLLLGAFAVVALLLALGGVHGVLSYAVSQRTREIGIRVALGAPRGAVVRQVVREGIRPVLLGLGMGMGAAVLMTRLLQSLLYGVTRTDPATYLAVSALLLAVALMASLVPARRATRVDLVAAVRGD